MTGRFLKKQSDDVISRIEGGHLSHCLPFGLYYLLTTIQIPLFTTAKVVVHLSNFDDERH